MQITDMITVLGPVVSIFVWGAIIMTMVRQIAASQASIADACKQQATALGRVADTQDRVSQALHEHDKEFSKYVAHAIAEHKEIVLRLERLERG